MRAPPAVLAALCAVLGPSAWAHDRSEGRSAFVLDDDGAVAITVEMLELDLPELCHVDLSLSDPLRVQEEEARLQRCLERGFPHWLRVNLDDAACPVRFSSWTRTQPKGVRFDATAACPAPGSGSLWRVDWGFFLATRLDHVSIARLRPPWGEPALVSFSKRNRKAELTLPAALGRPLLVAGAASLLAAATAVAVWRWRRHKRTRPSRARPAP